MNRKKTNTGRKIKSLLMNREILQRDFAKYCGCTHRTMQKYLNAKIMPFIVKEKAESLLGMKIRELNGVSKENIKANRGNAMQN